VYNGSGDDNSIVITGHQWAPKPMDLPIGKKDVQTVEVSYSVKKAKRKFNFGAICILESMAYLLER
jgi:hypothetical protein